MDISAVSLGFTPPASPEYYLSFIASRRSGPPAFVQTTGSAGIMESFTSYSGSVSPTIDWSGATYTDRLTAGGMVPTSPFGIVTLELQIASGDASNSSQGVSSYLWADNDYQWVWYSLHAGQFNEPQNAIGWNENFANLYINGSLAWSGDFYASNGVDSVDDGMAGANDQNYIISDGNSYPQAAQFGGDAGLYAGFCDTSDGPYVVSNSAITYSGYDHWGYTGSGPTVSNNGLVAGYGYNAVDAQNIEGSTTTNASSVFGPFLAETDINSRLLCFGFQTTFFNVGSGGVTAGDSLTTVGFAAGDQPINATLYNGKWYVGALSGSFAGSLYVSDDDTFSSFTPATLSSTDPALDFLSSGFVVWAIWNEGGNIYAVLGDTGFSQFVATQLNPGNQPTAAPQTNYPIPPVLPAACIPGCF